jgi:hypothetical protein
LERETVNGPLIDTLGEFMKTVDMIFGLYLDSVSAYKWAAQRLEQVQRDAVTEFGAKGQTYTLAELDAMLLHIGKRNANASEARFLHRCTQAQYKRRNGPGELNHTMIGNLCLVLIYQYWENHFRPRIAALQGVPIRDVKMEVMGDVRHLRESIIHHQGVGVPDVKKCVCLTWFCEGDPIQLTEDQFEEIVNLVKRGIVELAEGDIDALLEATSSSHPIWPTPA